MNGRFEKKYSPSPRPTFDRPTLIRSTESVRYIWGDAGAGEVADWIYVSSQMIHCLVFGLPVGGSFRHSKEFRTVFGADEVLHVLEGTMVLTNPETGEVVRVETGGSAVFHADTWHHAFAHGSQPLRVLELFAPPPAAGTSGAYARTRPYLEENDWSYCQDELLGKWPMAAADRRQRATIHVATPERILWRRDLGVLMGVMLSTPQLMVAMLEVGPGETSTWHQNHGDEVVFVVNGGLHVRCGDEAGCAAVLEAQPGDAVYVPAGCGHDIRSFGADARAVVAVAPTVG